MLRSAKEVSSRLETEGTIQGSRGACREGPRKVLRAKQNGPEMWFMNRANECGMHRPITASVKAAKKELMVADRGGQGHVRGERVSDTPSRQALLGDMSELSGDQGD